MNVDSTTSETQKISAVTEIQILEGKLGARIDILFIDSPVLYQLK